MTDTAAPFGFTFGASHVEKSWSDFQRVDWPRLVELLTSHVPGPKEGTCIVPAQFSGQRRHKDDAIRIDVAFLDSDSGATLTDIETALKAKGWEAVISSTHSHMTTLTKVKTSNWDRFFSRNQDATAEDFLIKDKGYLPTVARGAETERTEDEYVFIRHQPCPKFRIAIPLERPWLAADYASPSEANAVWKERIEALAASLGLDHDQACTDTSRLFFLPRRPASGVVPETAVTAGDHCDIFAIPAITADNIFAQPRLRKHYAELETGEYIDPVEGEIFDLTTWAKQFGATFLIAKALKARKPSVLTRHIHEGKVHIECPNSDAHTSPDKDLATYVMNGGSSSTAGFVIHCRHAHCTGKDRLFFVKKMLEHQWISLDDLTAPEFHKQPDTEKAEVKPAAKQKEPDGRPLPILWFHDIEPVLDARDFVQGVLLEEGAAVIYGESNAGKTFFGTDLSLHVASGLPWCGKRVEQGGVIYCVLEGGIGFKNRVAAWKADRGLQHTSLPFAAIPSGLNLLDPEADTPRLVEAIRGAAEKMDVPIKLIVIDTLARAMAGGNENAPDDMGALVMNMDTIRAATGACVMFIHHSGKDQAKGARGHSSLRAAIDTEIEVVADEGSDAKSATVVKQREMKKGDVFGFTLRVVDLGSNRHDEVVTTCLVDYGAADADQAQAQLRRRMSANTKRALEVLADLVATSGRLGDKGVPSGCSSVPEKWWRDQFISRAMPGAEPDTKQRAFRRSADALVGAHQVGVGGDRVWIVSKRMMDRTIGTPDDTNKLSGAHRSGNEYGDAG